MELDKGRIVNILEETQAMLTGHFKLSSGLHSDKYFQYALVLQYPEYAVMFGKALAGSTAKNEKGPQ